MRDSRKENFNRTLATISGCKTEAGGIVASLLLIASVLYDMSDEITEAIREAKK